MDLKRCRNHVVPQNAGLTVAAVSTPPLTSYARLRLLHKQYPARYTGIATFTSCIFCESVSHPLWSIIDLGYSVCPSYDCFSIPHSLSTTLPFRKTMSWCKNCQNIAFPESRREGGPFIFWGVSYPLSTSAFLQPSAKALQGSSANGCPLCSKFWTALCIDGRRETERILAADVDGQGVVFNIYHEENNAQWPFNGVAEIRCGDTFRYYRPKLPIPGKAIKN